MKQPDDDAQDKQKTIADSLHRQIEELMRRHPPAGPTSLREAFEEKPEGPKGVTDDNAKK